MVDLVFASIVTPGESDWRAAVMKPGYAFADGFRFGLDLVLDALEARSTSGARSVRPGLPTRQRLRKLTILGDLVRAWALYIFFRRVNKSVAMLAAWWMLRHDAIFGFALVGLVAASDVVGGTGALAGMTQDQARPLMMLLLEAHVYGFNLGLAFFSFHLLLNGYLAIVSREVPRILGVLLIVAFLGYLVDSTSVLLLVTPPAIIKNIVMLPNTIGELALVVWLVAKGGKQRIPATQAG